MSESSFHCQNKNRIQRVQQTNALNGLDYLEVDPSQTQLYVFFAHSLPGQPGEVPAGIDALTSDNFEIEGGIRVINIDVESASASGNKLTLKLSEPGDFSLYTLKLVARPGADKPPAGFDLALACIDFSFKINCPNEFDCNPACECTDSTEPSPPINYLARDYQGLRRVMVDRLRQIAPDWNEDHAADSQVALLEMVAYLGDYLSYYQDATTTEAYLGTARKRASVRRHTRLLDYRLHDGCNARTWVVFEIEAGSDSDGAILPQGSTVLTPLTREAKSTITQAIYEENFYQTESVFETLHNLTVHEAHNKISFYTWSDQSCCLPAGSIAADLDNSAGLHLEIGAVLLLEEQQNPETGSESNPDPAKRHAVRLQTIEHLVDPLDNTPVLRVTWKTEDALPFALTISGLVDDGESTTYASEISVARANVALAAHGQTRDIDRLSPDTVADGDDYRPRILTKNLSFREAFDPDKARYQAAASAVQQSPHKALPAIELEAGSFLWRPARDLLDSYASSREFVVETDDDGTAQLRFGDGIVGRKPEDGLVFTARGTFGNGDEGNIGAESLRTLVWEKGGIRSVRNPLPAVGGIDAEKVEEAKRDAPEAFMTQERAVTESDYAAIAARHPEVQKAVATFRWTGSWRTVFLSVDRMQGSTLADDELIAFLDTYRLAGYDVQITRPRYYPITIELSVCVAPGASANSVRQELYQRFSTGTRRDGTQAFFHPDRFSFGDTLYLSHIYEEALKVDGIAEITIQTFKRYGSNRSQAIAEGMITPDAEEVIRLDNDPNFPENGTLSIEAIGGI